jgi:outer membrane immunogenic protein
MKKLTLSLVAITLCTAANPVLGNGVTHVDQPAPAPAPAPAPVERSHFHGPHIGAQVGVGVGHTGFDHQVYRFQSGTPGRVLYLRANGRRSEAGVLGGLHAGWDWVFNNKFLAGVEASGDLSSLSGKISAVNASFHNAHTKTDMDWSVTVGARGGMVMDQTALYVSASWVGAEWEIRQTMDTRGSTAAVGGFSGRANEHKKSHFLNGFRPAIGMATFLDKDGKFLLSLEAGYTWFESTTVRNEFRDDILAGVANSALVQFQSTKINPEVFDAKIKFSWKIKGVAS